MQNLIPTKIIAAEYITNLQNLAAQQSNVARMHKLYELAAPFVESHITFWDASWHILLSLSRKNYLHIVEEYAKLENKEGGYVGKEHTVPPIIHNDYYVPRELLEKYKPINLEKINLGETECPQVTSRTEKIFVGTAREVTDKNVRITIESPQTIIYTGE